VDESAIRIIKHEVNNSILGGIKHVEGGALKGVDNADPYLLRQVHLLGRAIMDEGVVDPAGLLPANLLLRLELLHLQPELKVLFAAFMLQKLKESMAGGGVGDKLAEGLSGDQKRFV